MLGLLVLAMAWLPVPLASNRAWSTALIALWLWAVLLGACLLRCLGQPLPVPAPSPGMPALHQHAVSVARGQRRFFGPQALPVLLLVACNGWIALQSLSPWGHSEDAYQSQIYLLRSMACLAGFGCVLLLANTGERRKWLLMGLFSAGILQALVAVVLFSTNARYEFLGYLFTQGTRATGTFPNSDHLANYMALTLAAGMALMLGQMGSPPADAATGSVWRRGLQGTLQFLLSTKMLIRLMLVLLVITLVLTRSRMGNGAFFLALPVLAMVLGSRSRQLRKPAIALVVSLLLVDIVIVGQWVGLEKVVQRLEATEITLANQPTDASEVPAPAASRPHREETWEERMRAAEDTLHMVQAKPWSGWGAGSYYAVFPKFKRDGLGRYEHTHFDYIEIVADIGLVGLALLVAVFLLTLRRVWQLLTDDHSPQVRGLAAGVGMAMLCALLHGFVDFTLQITANSVLLTVLLSMVWAVPGRESSTVVIATAGRAMQREYQGKS